MGKKLRFFLLYLQTFWQKEKKHFLWGLILGFFGTLFIFQVYPFYLEWRGSGTKRIGLVGRYTENSLPLKIQNQLSLGLTLVSPNGSPSPSLASSWEISPDGKVYVFHLLSKIFWHDGKPFSAKDIHYQLKGATFSFPDDYTLKVSLQEPYAPLPVVLSQPLLRPNLLGLGVYQAGRRSYLGETISELHLLPRIKDLPKIIYRFYPNLEAAILGFKLGEVDILENLPKLGDLEKWKNLKIAETTLFDRVVLLFFNLQKPFLQEKEVRQALTYAIPDFPGTEKAFSPLSPLSWAFSRKIRLYQFDPAASRKILARSPLSSTSGELTLVTAATYLPVAQKLVEAFYQVGVKTKVKVENTPPSDFDFYLTVLPLPPDPDQYQYWQSTQTETNFAHYHNPKIDKLLEDGRRTVNLEVRKKIYADFQKYLVDDVPAIFLFYPKVYRVERK